MINLTAGAVVSNPIVENYTTKTFEKIPFHKTLNKTGAEVPSAPVLMFNIKKAN